MAWAVRAPESFEIPAGGSEGFAIGGWMRITQGVRDGRSAAIPFQSMGLLYAS